jgi:hypothetical protein
MVVPVTAEAASRTDPDAVELSRLSAWLTVVGPVEGREHAVLSDGRHHLRLDVAGRSIRSEGAVILRYDLYGVATALRRLLPVRRLIDLCRFQRFSASLYPRDPLIRRGVTLLRVSDALADGASQREIAVALFGPDRVSQDWIGRSDALRSLVRRLVADARYMEAGGYRSLLQSRRSPPGP